MTAHGIDVAGITNPPDLIAVKQFGWSATTVPTAGAEADEFRLVCRPGIEAEGKKSLRVETETSIGDSVIPSANR
jgi:hypothetical protein